LAVQQSASFSPRGRVTAKRSDAPAWSRETPLSTKGLEAALDTDVVDCKRPVR